MPFDALAQLKGPGLRIGTALPRFRQVALEREILVVLSLVGKGITQQAVVGERGYLEQTYRIGQAWIEHWRILGRGTRQDTAAFGGFIAWRGPGGIGRRRMGQGT